MRLFPDLRAAIDVEKGDRGRQRPRSRAQRRLDIGGRGLLATTMAKSCSTGRNRGTETSAGIGCATSRSASRSISATATRGASIPNACGPVGPQLAEHPDLLSAREKPRRPARMERGGIDAAELDFLDSEPDEQRLDRPLEVEEVELAIVGGAESAQRLPLAGKDHPQDVRLARQFIAGGKIDAGHLEEPDTVLMLEVLGGDGEQARQQRRPQDAAVGLQRVAQADQAPKGRPDGHPRIARSSGSRRRRSSSLMAT